MLEIEVDDLHKLKEDKTVLNSRHDFVGLTMTAPNHLRGPRCTKNRHLNHSALQLYLSDIRNV